LDALADAVGPAAEDEHLPAIGRRRLALVLVRRVEVRRVRLELGAAGVDALVDRDDAQLLARGAPRGLGGAGERRDAAVAHAAALEAAEVGLHRREAAGLLDADLVHRHLADLAEEPRVDAGEIVRALDREAELEGARELEDAVGAGDRDGALE